MHIIVLRTHIRNIMYTLMTLVMHSSGSKMATSNDFGNKRI